MNISLFHKPFIQNSNYSDAVSYIQAYLKERDILYPRHIIENFLTLIRTNDLIILAGDSGSGKTNLVQSFAKAIGGVSKIIPVKPNWTSSEDLLGYYNPLEKKYLATPFLEALIEAKQNPDIPYFICLDEMNLARVEYYFADFLSKLEERNEQPTIQLYSDDEAAHVLAELKGVVSVISNAQEKFSKNGIVDFVALMQDEEINAEMKRAFGFSDKDSL
ncbi:AAA family ATPase, partial [Klebsiella pneumoniae]|uniref:AAA family ATPase n=1 Tax=Klebsiella pneumoniae TaxID=573 RepID=UPI003EDED406